MFFSLFCLDFLSKNFQDFFQATPEFFQRLYSDLCPQHFLQNFSQKNFLEIVQKRKRFLGNKFSIILLKLCQEISRILQYISGNCLEFSPDLSSDSPEFFPEFSSSSPEFFLVFFIISQEIV